MSKKCNIGWACGKSCIAKTKECKIKVSIKSTEALDDLVTNMEIVATTPKDATSLLGQGQFSKVYDNGDGTVTKIGLLGAEEIYAMKAAENAGLNSPFVKTQKMGFAVDDLAEQLTGEPLENLYKFTDDEIEMMNLEKGALIMSKVVTDKWSAAGPNEKQFASAVKQLNALHKAGYSHNDISLDNIKPMKNKKNEVAILDFGAATRLQDPSDAFEDTGRLYEIYKTMNLSKSKDKDIQKFSRLIENDDIDGWFKN